MIRTATATAALIAVCSTSALAAGYTIPAGNYTNTTQIQAIMNDTTGICSAILTVGEVQMGTGAVKGLGKTTQVVTPVPAAASGGNPPSLGVQVCNYSALPATLNASGTTPITGSTTCTVNGTSYTLTTTAGNGNIVNVPATNNDAFFLNATSSVSAGGTTLCSIQTSQLNVYTGPLHK